MGGNRRAGILRAGLSQPACREGGMDDAGALPDPHVFAAGLLFHVIAQIHIRQEQDRLLARNRVDDVHGVARGAHNVALGFHFH